MSVNLFILGRALRGFWAMSRPLQLVAVCLAFLLGLLIARDRGAIWDGTALAWGLAALLPIAISIHYANEYADHLTDALTQPTPFSGGSGALPKGLLPRRWALYGASTMVSIGLALGYMAYWWGFIPLAAYGVLVAGAFWGWMYSLPPLRLAWRGWGEFDNALLGGMALPCYGYTLLTDQLDVYIFIFTLPFVTLVFINLLATTWADRLADSQVGKYTLATRLPTSQLRLIYVMAVAFFILTTIVISRFVADKTYLLSLLCALPFLAWGILDYTRTHSPHHTVFAMMAMFLSQLFIRVFL